MIFQKISTFSSWIYPLRRTVYFLMKSIQLKQLFLAYIWHLVFWHMTSKVISFLLLSLQHISIDLDAERKKELKILICFLSRNASQKTEFQHQSGNHSLSTNGQWLFKIFLLDLCSLFKCDLSKSTKNCNLFTHGSLRSS